MNRRLILASSLSLLGIAMFVAALRADEIKLKDGTKITGTIVGFEENSFKVKTSYGFAVVQKDQVVSIIVSDTSKKAAAGTDKTRSRKVRRAGREASEDRGRVYCATVDCNSCADPS